jgi:hypothetical protein
MMRLGYPCAIQEPCLALRDDYHPSIHKCQSSSAIRYHHRGKTRATCESLVIEFFFSFSYSLL